MPVSVPTSPRDETDTAPTPLTWRLVRADGRPAEVVAFEESVVAFFLDAATMLGVPKSVAAIYGVCFASAEPLSYTEVRDRLDISAGSISQGIRVLREVGAIKVVTSDVDRREYFTPDLALRKLVARYLEQRVASQLSSGRSRLKSVAKAVPAGKNGSGKVLRDRLKALQTWHDKAHAVLPLIRTFLKLG